MERVLKISRRVMGNGDSYFENYFINK